MMSIEEMVLASGTLFYPRRLTRKPPEDKTDIHSRVSKCTGSFAEI